MLFPIRNGLDGLSGLSQSVFGCFFKAHESTLVLRAQRSQAGCLPLKDPANSDNSFQQRDQMRYMKR